MKVWKGWYIARGKKVRFEPPSKSQRQYTNRKYYLLHRHSLLNDRRKYREDNKKRINARRRLLYKRNKSKDVFVVSNA